MLFEDATHHRDPKTDRLEADLCIVGGGLAGTCAAITAARAGIRVVLMQDRPVLGGNASSEVRLWVLGATVHMMSNNRWSREGGVVDEFLVENLYRNHDGNPVLVDPVLLEMVTDEPNLTLLLNTSVFDCTKVDGDADRIASVRGFCAQNSTMYEVHAPLFCDASGDGILGFVSGAAFRMGAEPPEEFDEPFAPTGEFGYLLGHSIYFYTRDTGRPTTFIPPSFALKDVPDAVPRIKQMNIRHHGCGLWWIEHGGRMDTVHDTEKIKWDLWRVVYGIWDHIKNSGEYPDAETQTLEWVGMIPGKRESRRFEGDYILRQADVVGRRWHDDDVAHGGWSIDLHPADGVFATHGASRHLYTKGIYPIPYRCYYSRNIANLFLAGRIISATHVAFGSTRVMATCALGGQAVGMAAAVCRDHACDPRDVTEPDRMTDLQRRLQRVGQHLIGRPLDDPDDLARRATITATSALALAELPANGPRINLEAPFGQMLPVGPGPMATTTFHVTSDRATTIEVELRTTSDVHHHAPDVLLGRRSVQIAAAVDQPVTVDFSDIAIDQPRYVWLTIRGGKSVELRLSERRLTGVVSTRHVNDHDFTNVGGEAFPVFQITRRPDGQNLAMILDPPLDRFAAASVINGYQRPTNQPNAWVASFDDDRPTLRVAWDAPVTIGRIELAFDTDFDHAMETVLRGHPENEIPFCVRHYRLLDGTGRVLHERTDNHQTRNTITLDQPLTTDTLSIEVLASCGPCPAAIFELRCYNR